MKHVLLPSILVLIFSLLISAAPPAGSDQALLDQGIQLTNQGRYVEAFDTLSTIRIQFPDSTLLPAAEYQMALTSLYDARPVEAALQFQRVISKFPASAEAKQARNMNAILYRLYVAPTTNKRIYVPDSSYSAMISDLDEPVGLGMDAEGKLYLADRGKKVLYTFDPAGKLTNTTTVLSPFGLTVTAKNEVLVGNDTNVYIPTREPVSFARINPETQARMGNLEQVRSVAQNDKGHYYVVSGRVEGVAIYDASGNPLPGALGRAEEFDKVIIDSVNNIYLLTRKGDALQVYNPDAKPLFSITKTGRELTFGKIEDFAVDAANHVYLLTDNPRGIGIYSPQGKFLRYLPFEKNTQLFLDDPKVITVGPSGSIYVVEKGTKRIVKIG